MIGPSHHCAGYCSCSTIPQFELNLLSLLGWFCFLFEVRGWAVILLTGSLYSAYAFNVRGSRCVAGGIAERNVIDEKTRDQILKHVPVMKSFKMFEAAEYMEAWVLDKLPLEPLLDASAFLV